MNLKAYLSENNIPPVEFAAAINVHLTTLYRYTRGGRLPDPDILERIAQETGGAVQPNDFYDFARTATEE